MEKQILHLQYRNPSKNYIYSWKIRNCCTEEWRGEKSQQQIVDKRSNEIGYLENIMN